MKLIVGAVPYEALLITMTDHGRRRDINMNRYTNVQLILTNPLGVEVSTQGGVASVTAAGQVRYTWPPTTLFPDPGDYTLKLHATGPNGISDWSDPVTIEVYRETP